jgi:hypothetical protein
VTPADRVRAVAGRLSASADDDERALGDHLAANPHVLAHVLSEGGDSPGAVPWVLAAVSRRDAELVELARTRSASKVWRLIATYRSDTWPRTRLAPVCPHDGDEVRAALWRALRHLDRELSLRQVQSIVKRGMVG